MANLAVNVDHVATLRQARQARYPDPVAAALIAETAGADGIVVHLREDRRHIQERDVRILRQVVQTKLILEMAATDSMLDIALEIRPDLVTLVPEKREELTTEGGLDLSLHRDTVAQAVKTLQQNGIPVSIFIDPEDRQIELAHKIKASMIEIHTGVFCEARTPENRAEAFAKIAHSASQARQLNLGVNAGHGLDYISLPHIKRIAEIDEFSIGHSIVARAVLVGMEQAVRDMLALLKPS